MREQLQAIDKLVFKCQWEEVTLFTVGQLFHDGSINFAIHREKMGSLKKMVQAEFGEMIVEETENSISLRMKANSAICESLMIKIGELGEQSKEGEGWKETLFMGCRIKVPNRKDWVDLFNCPHPAAPGGKLDFRDFFSEEEKSFNYLHPHCAVKPIQRWKHIDSVETFVEMTRHFKEPFILEDTKILSCSREQFANWFTRQRVPILGYFESGGHDYQEPSAVWRQFSDKSLKINVVNTQMDMALVEEICPPGILAAHRARMNRFDPDNLFTWVFTIAPTWTHFHYDLHVDEEDNTEDPRNMGGYMKVLEGEKVWWCIPYSSYRDCVLSKGLDADSLAKKGIIDLLTLTDDALYGHIYAGYIRDGDLLYFPPTCLHAVTTQRNTFGFGGWL